MTVIIEDATHYGKNGFNLKTWIENGLLILSLCSWFSDHYDSIHEFMMSILHLVFG